MVLVLSRKALILRKHIFLVPSGSRPKHLQTRPKADFDGMDGMNGMGWDGREYQKCSSIFFILCEYID